MRQPLRNGKHVRWEIPSAGTVEFDEGVLPVDPYLVGALLGDGTLYEHAVQFSTGDDELLGRLQELVAPYGCVSKHITNYDWRFAKPQRGGPNRLLDSLRAIGLTSARSWEKHIPPDYLLASPSDRLELLRGLMDTDGSQGRQGQCSFASTSEALADGVAFIVRSLGGRASKIGMAARQGRPYWLVTIRLSESPFWLTRKRERWEAYRPKYERRRAISQITKTRRAETVCVKVSGGEGLYVTDDLIVTHNTNIAGGVHEKIAEWIPGIHIHRAHWPYEELIEWLTTMTCYVGPSRGEGNLKPPMEFMATGGTVIATNWSGPTNWLDEQVGYPLDYTLRPMNPNNPDSPQEARASKDHLKQLMWRVHTHREEATKKGLLSAQHIREVASWDTIIPQLVADIEQDLAG